MHWLCQKNTPGYSSGVGLATRPKQKSLLKMILTKKQEKGANGGILYAHLGVKDNDDSDYRFVSSHFPLYLN